MNRDDWNERYAASELVWGAAPNRLVARETETLRPRRALDLACGEGRNAVWLAEQGWRVTGIDFSSVAIERARRLAAERGVSLELAVADVLETPLEPRAFDLVLLAYLQLPPDERRRAVKRAAEAVRERGTFLLVAHDLRNLADGHGGPQSPSLLWTAGEVADQLAELGLAVERAGEVLRDVEGAPRPAIDTVVRAHRPG